MPKFLDIPQWYGSSSSTPLSLWETAGSSGQYLSSNGSGSKPTWKAVPRQTTYPHSLSGICVATFDDQGSVQKMATVVIPVDWNLGSLSSSNDEKFGKIIVFTFLKNGTECSFPVYGGYIQFPSSVSDVQTRGSVIMGHLQDADNDYPEQNVRFDYINPSGAMANATFSLSRITSCLYWKFNCDTGTPDSTFLSYL